MAGTSPAPWPLRSDPAGSNTGRGLDAAFRPFASVGLKARAVALLTYPPMFRFTLALIFATVATALHAQGLEGKVEGKTYISPTGIFKVVIPVLPELGGDITDTPNVVTFQDDFNVHVSIAAFPQDATQRWELSTRGPKDYLIYFFSNFVLSDFKQTFEGVQIESAKFVPGMMDGALLTYL